MPVLFISADQARAMYPGGKADATARRLARLWARLFSLGLAPRRWVTLEVPGRRSGQPRQFPLGMADVDGQWYLVSMLGERSNWVQNVRAAGGAAVLRHGRATRCRLAEVEVADRPAIIRRYLQVAPGGRPHIPVECSAPVEEFAAVADRYPVFRVIPDSAADSEGGSHVRARQHDRPVRRRRWRRWAIASVLALVVVAVLGGVTIRVFVAQQQSAAPLSLPAGHPSAPAGPVAGTWHAAGGSAAGFRVAERALGATNVVVGRTSTVTGSVVADGSAVSRASFRVTLTALRVDGKPQQQLATSLNTSVFPVAEIRLTSPIVLSPAFASGATVHVSARGVLSLNGLTRSVTISLDARRDGALIEAAGSIPVSFATWHISQPAGFGWFGSLADHGTAEFRLILRHA